jgi:hypothetical protein
MKFTLIIFLSSFLYLSAAETEIKTTNLKNAVIDSSNTSSASESITPQQMEELKKQMNSIKANQKKSEEMLNDLDKEQ